MVKNQKIVRSAISGRYVTKKIGTLKAKKFTAVEGMKLSPKSAKTYASLRKTGLEGDQLRSAISEAFKTKRV